MRLLHVVQNSAQIAAAAAEWLPSKWAQDGCRLADALTSAGSAVGSADFDSTGSAGVALALSRDAQPLHHGATFVPGEKLRLAIGGIDMSHPSRHQLHYAFYATAGQFGAVWASWCGGLLAANEPAEWTAPMDVANVTLLGARVSHDAADAIVYQVMMLQRAGPEGPSNGTVMDSWATEGQPLTPSRPDPGTGLEAFFTASIPLILLAIGVIGLLVNHALTAPERRPPHGAVQIVDGEVTPVPHTLHTHQSPAAVAPLPQVLEAMHEAGA